MTIDMAVTYEELGVNVHGRPRTKALFYEWKHFQPHVKPVYNLSRRDHDDTLSMYQLYMKFDTEYEAAMHLLGNWEHWNQLCGSSAFKPYLEKWRDERKIREEAMAHRILVEAAEGGNVAAAKTILIDSKKVNNVGRPTNQQVEKAARAQAELDAFLVHSIKKA